MAKTDVCAPIIIPKPEEPKRPCPSCIPDENYVEPIWYKTTEPYLNKKTCEYMVSVSVNSRADVWTTRTVKKSGMNFKKLLKTYIRPGIRLMLRHFDKLESDQVLCASYTTEDTSLADEVNEYMLTHKSEFTPRETKSGGTYTGITYTPGDPIDTKKAYGDSGLYDKNCRDILLDFDYGDFVDVKEELASLSKANTYKIFDVNERLREKFPNIKNFNALEIYGKAVDYHFTGYGESVMQVLVTIPAYIFDQVPEAPELPEVDTSVKTVFIGPRRLRTDLAKLREALSSYAQFQSYFYKFENGSLYHESTGDPFYIKFYIKRIQRFEHALEKLLRKNGFDYMMTVGIPWTNIEIKDSLGVQSPDMPWKIKFVFDKSDETKPFTLKRVGAKRKGCYYKKLKKGLSSFLKKPLIQDQTLMGLIANLDNIRMDLEARETMGWLDFVLKYIYPDLAINYGSMEKYKKTTAVNCLADKIGLNGLDDFVHNIPGRFSELFAYSMNKGACRALRDEKPYPLQVKTDGSLDEKYIEEWAKVYNKRLFEFSELEQMLKSIKENWDEVNGSEGALQALLANLNPCNFFQLGLKAIQCLMSGMNLQDAYRAIIKKALATMAGAALEKVIEALPYDKQEKIRNLVEKEFKDMPAPWETDYEPGSLEKAIDRMAMDDVEAKAKKYSDMAANKQSAEMRIEEIQERIEQYEHCLMFEMDCTKDGEIRPVPEPTGRAEYFDPDSPMLRKGSKGDAVTNLQIALNEFDYKLEEDGIFGNKTRKAVKAYQTSRKILIDGIVGPQTKGTLNADLDAKDGAAKQQTLTQELMKEIIGDANTAKLSELELKEKIAAHELVIVQWDIDTEEQVKIGIKYLDLLEETKKKRQALVEQMEKFESNMDKYTLKSYDDQIKEYQTKLDQQEEISQALITGRKDLEDVLKMYNDELKKVQKEKKEKVDDRDDIEKVVNEKIIELKKKWAKNRDDLLEEIEKQKKKISENDPTSTDSIIYKVWNAEDEDSKALLALIEREKHDKAFVSGLSPDDEIEQGTYGKALGNVQQAIAMAYVEAIMEVAEIQELLTIIDKVPGIKLLGDFIAKLQCPVVHYIYPPISSFLGTLTFDPCGPGKTRLAFPEIQKLPSFNGWNFLKLIGKAFINALKDVVIEIMFAIIFKIASIVFDVTCAMLGAAGKAALGAMTGDMGWKNAVDDIFCGKDRPEEEQADFPALVLSTAVPSLPPNPRELAETLSVIGTKGEYQRAITSAPEDQDMDFMANLSTLVAAVHPEYSDTLGSPDQFVQFFAQVGNLLTEDQIIAIQDTLIPEDNLPLEESCICNEAELQQWNEDKQEALENAGLSPEIAKDFVDRQNERRKTDLADVAEILAKGPGGMIGDAIDAAINGGGGGGHGGAAAANPDCAVVSSAGMPKLEDNKQVQDAMKKATEGMFKRLEAAFIDDTVLWRSPLDPRSWADTPGILSVILGDTQNYTLNFHFIARNNVFFRFMNFMTWGFWPKYEEFPETVGITFYNALKDTEFVTDDDKTTFPIKYDITDNYEWNSKIIITDKFKEKIGPKRINSPSFDYKFKQKSPENVLGTFRVESVIESSTMEWLRRWGLEPKNAELNKYTYREIFMRNLLRHAYKDFPDVEITAKESKTMIKEMQDMANSKFIKSLITVDGNKPQGFMHGSMNQDIKAEHLEYVAPNGGEYDYEEEDAVFGKAKERHDRVKFLDPSEYGGSYTSPKVYISPPKDEGLMRISQVFLPDLKSGCSPKVGSTHFLFLDDIKEIINKARNSIPPNEKLKYAPDCVKEYPFAKVASPATLSSLEGVVIATIRVYIAEFFIKTMPIWSSIDIGSDDGISLRNYDELLPEYIAKLMKRGLSNEKSWMARATYEGYPYWLMFLEQVAQTVKRRVKDGDIKSTADIKKSFDDINKIQNEHVVPTFDKMKKISKKYKGDIRPDDLDDDYLAESIVKGGALIGGIMDRGDLPKGGTLGTVGWSIFGLNQAKFSAKIWSIHRGRKAAENLLKYLIIEQLSFYRVKLQEKLHQIEVQPNVYDINKMFIGKQGVAVGPGIESGIYETEAPEVPVGQKRDYGDVSHVTPNPRESHTLTNLSDSEKDDIKKYGGFYLEKYIRIYDKEVVWSDAPPAPEGESVDAQAAAEQIPSIPKFVFDRAAKLKGVVNILEFKKWLKEHESDLTDDLKISDWFHFDPEKDGEIIPPKKGSAAALAGKSPPPEPAGLGIRFGVRLCYIPSNSGGFNPFAGGVGPPHRKASMKEKSYYVEGIPGLTNSKYTFPIDSYESEISDIPLKELLETNDSLNQDLKCYVDRLVLNGRFDLFMNKILNLKRTASLVTVMTYDGWVPSIGAIDSEERLEPEVPEEYESDDEDEGPPTYSDPAGTPYFNDSRKECRKLFIANYKRDDFDPEDEEDDFDPIKDNFNRMMSNTYTAVTYDSDVPFWMKWRVVKDNPDDEEGNPCGNQYTKLFNKS